MPNRILWILITLVCYSTSAHAQWLNLPIPGTPRTKDGKPNLSAPAPRASNGKPDLSGIWMAEPAPREVLLRIFPDGVNLLGENPTPKYFMNILSDFKPDETPLKGSMLATFREHAGGHGKDFPPTHCLPLGVPVADVAPEPFKVIQTPAVIVMLYEADTTFRQIHTDGRKLPVDPQPSWFGYSVGKWDGDSLVVETTGLSDRSWLDAVGHPHSDAMHVSERFHRRDFGHMEVQITIDDPQTYTQPFTIQVNENLFPDTDIIESICLENEKDASHLTAK